MMSLTLSTGTPQPIINTLNLNFGGTRHVVTEINTTNPGKLAEYERAGLVLKGLKLVEIPERQLNDAERKSLNAGVEGLVAISKSIAADKAIAAYQQAKRPVVIEDTSWWLDASLQTTGPAIKQYCDTGDKGLDHLCLIAKHEGVFTATAMLVLAAAFGDSVVRYTAQVPGMISEFPKGTNGFGWDKIFIPMNQNQLFRFGNIGSWDEIPAPERSLLSTWAEMSTDAKMTRFPFRLAAVNEIRKQLNS